MYWTDDAQRDLSGDCTRLGTLYDEVPLHAKAVREAAMLATTWPRRRRDSAFCAVKRGKFARCHRGRCAQRTRHMLQTTLVGIPGH
jgi:hypothetical protein